MIMPHAGWQVAIRIAATMSMLVIGIMLFALLWIKLTPGLEAKDVRIMIRDSGLQIYSLRRSLKAIKRAVDGHTLKIAMMGSGILGALFVIANMFGTLCAVSVLYLFLSVIVIYGIYEETFL
jgi:preprotein translocase subunit SecY